VFQEDLEDKMLDCESQGVEVGEATRERVAMMQARGPLATFADLTSETQQTYVEVSLTELAAYVHWRSKQVIGTATTEFEAGWDLLDCDAKAEWIVEDPRDFLAQADPAWAPLLSIAAENVVKTKAEKTSLEAEIPCTPCKSEKVAAATIPSSQQKIVKAELAEKAAAATVPPKVVKAEPAEPSVEAPMPPPEKPLPKKVAKDEASPPTDPPNPSLAAQQQGKTANAAVSPVLERLRKAVEARKSPKSPEDAVCPVLARLQKACGAVDAARKLAPSPQPDSRDSVKETKGSQVVKQILRGRGRARGKSGPAGAALSRRKVAKESEDEEEEDAEDYNPDDEDIDEESEAELDEQPKEAHSAQGRGRVRSRSVATVAESVPAAIVPVPHHKKRKLAPENLFPEALEAVCCVCNKDHSSTENDLCLCDKCDRGFHALCHDPPVDYFGSLEDQWFCSDCSKDLAKDRGLRAKVADFVWAKFTPNSSPWPARVTRIDFTSLADPRPYFVQYFDSGASQGSWVGESQLLLWSEGPDFSSISDNRRRLAVRMAEGDGAAPISSALAQAPIKPLPQRRPGAPRKSENSSAPLADHPMQPVAKKRTQRLNAKSPPQRHRLAAEDPEELELSSQVQEMREIVKAAKERQARIEKQYQDSVEASQSQIA